MKRPHSVQSLFCLWAQLLKDAAGMCAVNHADLLRDLKTVEKRSACEMLSFFTIILPQMGADFDRALEAGRIDASHFKSFKKCGKIPAFLRGYFRLVFDDNTGAIHENPSIISIACIRQLLYAFKKILLPCSYKRNRATLAGYLEIENELASRHTDGDTEFEFYASKIWTQVFLDPDMDFNPSHGPGAVAERLSPNGKFRMSRWHDRLEHNPLLTFAENVISPAASQKLFEKVMFVEEDQEQPVRVVTVPKTAKGGRIIAVEPCCMQYMQHKVEAILKNALEKHPLTSGHINFSDQNVNKALALENSATRQFATLDLSSASDRVPYDLAIKMFSCNPILMDMLERTRSRRAKIEGEVIHLHKFASMGSSTCFPVESMYFYTICVMARLKKYGLRPTQENIYSLSRDVYVYGDDIIIPTRDTAEIIDALHKYHCKVNTQKSYYRGFFRESCGCDAYASVDVTPVYIRRMINMISDQNDANTLLSAIATSNQLHQVGYWRTADFLKTIVERKLGELPCSREHSVAWFSFCGNRYQGVRYMRNKSVSRKKVRAVIENARANYEYTNFLTHDRNVDTYAKLWHPVPQTEPDSLRGEYLLTKVLLNLSKRHPEALPLQGDHERSTMRSVIALKQRWTPI